MVIVIIRCESFNGLVRLHNIHSNRHASSDDVAVQFTYLETLRNVLEDGSRYSCTCNNVYRYIIRDFFYIINSRIGPGLKSLAAAPEVQKYLYGRTSKEVLPEKTIYTRGVLRKVQLKHTCMLHGQCQQCMHASMCSSGLIIIGC